MVTVSDTGCGIDKKTQERMFEPFFTTKNKSEGTGLGLSVVYGIVRDHGGHIRCNSTLGEGTTFRIYLPATEKESNETADKADLKSETPISGAGKTILLAEDEPTIQNLVQTFFASYGYEVIGTSDGQEALEKYKSAPDKIDAIILDMNMPRMGGERCLKELVKLGCKAPVILATGALLSPEQEEDLMEHASGVVMKPFRHTALINSVAQAMANNGGNAHT